MSCRGKPLLNVNGHLYSCDKSTDEIQYWCCNQRRLLRCTARASTGRPKPGKQPTIKLRGVHNHGIIQERRKPGEYAKLKLKYELEKSKQAQDSKSLTVTRSRKEKAKK